MRFPVARLTSFRRCSLVRDAKEVAKNGLDRTWYTQSTSERPFRSALLSLNKRWENCKWRGDPTVNIYFLFITCEWSSSLRKLGRNTWESAFAIPTSCSFHSFLHGVAGSVVAICRQHDGDRRYFSTTFSDLTVPCNVKLPSWKFHATGTILGKFLAGETFYLHVRERAHSHLFQFRRKFLVF